MNLLNPLESVPVDKQGHFIIGVFIYSLFHFINPILGLCAVALAAVGKEAYDWFNRDTHTPDVFDALATMLGGVVGFICGLTSLHF